MSVLRLLVIDEPDQASRWQAVWPESRGTLRFVSRSEQASADLQQKQFDVAVVRHGMPGRRAQADIEFIRQVAPELAVLVVANQPDWECAVYCVRTQVRDMLVEPLTEVALQEAIQVAGQCQPASPNPSIESPRVPANWAPEFLGSSPGMQTVQNMVRQVATTNVDVLILGETGTGKELVARSLHSQSARSDQPFVAVDCGAIPETLMESEFFGHEKGAFTGADKKRTGFIQYADHGTLFLDEIGELPLPLQSKLLRVLQERVLRPVGSREEIAVDVRIVAATSRNLEEMIREKRFREDLYYRVNVVRIELPPLRDRGDDIGLLIEHFSARFSRDMGKPVIGVTPEAYQVLRQYSWPGNIRELQNVMRRGIALCKERFIGVEDLPDELVTRAGERIGGKEATTGGGGYFAERDRHLALFEQHYLSDLLKRHQGNVKAAAQEAALPRGTLYRLMKNHQLDSSDFR